MMKVNLCLIIFVPSLVLSVAIRDSYLKAFDNTKRISPLRRESFFLSGFYNKEGKPHDLGADFGLTSDVYTKPNPFYTKNQSVDKKPEPVYHPVYNHSVTQDEPSSGDAVDSVAPSIYDSKNSYPSSAYGVPSSTYGAGSYSVQSVPSSSYSVQNSNYGSSGASSYYSQPSSYGQPHLTYGQPSPNPHSSYGAQSYYPSSVITHQMPEAQKSSHSEWFLAKIMKKFDLILMSKILLKLIIFKKIVKFIGIICLLLFIPVLKKKFEEHTDDGEEEEEERRIKELDAYADVDFRIREIANFAFTAIEGFSYDNIPWCVGKSPFYCRLQYMLDSIDLRYPGSRILYLWFPKLQTTTTSTTTPPETTVLERDFDEGTVDFNDSITESLDVDSVEDIDSSENKIDKFNAMFKR